MKKEVRFGQLYLGYNHYRARFITYMVISKSRWAEPSDMWYRIYICDECGMFVKSEDEILKDKLLSEI